MKQVININFQGRIVPIEVTAYEILKSYIESLSRHFDAEEGKDEIINDIENRIGELFQERIKAGATCIIDDDVNAIIKSIGRPEDFDDAEPSSATGSQNTQQNNTNSTQNQTNLTSTSGKKRLFRDENHKLVGGVCSGVANYFDIDIAIVRVVFLILLFSFGIGFIPYIILWIAVPSSATTVIGSRRKKLYRDIDEKYVGGVASGIANYFGINVWIPRVFFLLPLVSLTTGRNWGHFGGYHDFNVLNLSPGPLFIYIILWIVLPEAKTTAEKLEMKGEKVDMNSIKESVVEEMKGVQQRVQKFGKEAATVASEKGNAFGTEAANLGKRGGNVFADIITFIVKAFVYSILALVGFSLVIALFSAGIASFSVFPLKDFIFTSGWQNALAWGTLIFFILVPMIGIITWVIRKITKVKTGSKMLRLSFIAMWVVGWVCVTFLIASISKDFNYNSTLSDENVAIINPGVNALDITNAKSGVKYSRNNWLGDNDFFDLSGDDESATIRNVRVNIEKSNNDSFKVTLLKYACGRKARFADSLASLINFNIQQKDSTLILDRGVVVNTKDKFRNQRVIVTIYVPVGKRIRVQNNIGWLNQLHFDGPGFQTSSDDDLTFGNIETGWETGVWYTMTKDGLYTLGGKRASNDRINGLKINEDGIDLKNGKQRIRINENGVTVDENEENSDEENNDGSYRYNDITPANKFDSAKINLQKEEKRFKDSLEEEKKKIDKQLEKYNNSTTGIYNSLPSNLLMSILN
jgi:phage shock protein PspC (stress-responsive transcriptional regulator)